MIWTRKYIEYKKDRFGERGLDRLILYPLLENIHTEMYYTFCKAIAICKNVFASGWIVLYKVILK